jgi:hypothetical protein
MKQTISTASQFRDAFHRAGRGEQFSYEALGLLFEYLDAVDPDMELDVVEICCDYAESTPAEIMENYSLENEEMAEDYVSDNGRYIGTTSEGSIVYQQF